MVVTPGTLPGDDARGESGDRKRALNPSSCPRQEIGGDQGDAHVVEPGDCDPGGCLGTGDQDAHQRGVEHAGGVQHDNVDVIAPRQQRRPDHQTRWTEHLAQAHRRMRAHREGGAEQAAQTADDIQQRERVCRARLSRSSCRDHLK
jgi:hypothetical protein